MNAELTESGVLELAIGRVIFDRLHVAAELVARVQDRRMPVGEPRAVVEGTTGQFAEAIEMRLDMAEQRVGQVDAQEVGENRIGAVEIHARGVGRKQVRLWRYVVLEELMHF